VQQELINAAGGTGKALKALLLIGAFAAGYEVSELAEEARRLLYGYGSLEPALRVALEAMLRELSDARQTDVRPMSDSTPQREVTGAEYPVATPATPAATAGDEGDPLTEIGFDV
jgi:hypothetical protein